MRAGFATIVGPFRDATLDHNSGRFYQDVLAPALFND
jgi:hypothetical protein